MGIGPAIDVGDRVDIECLGEAGQIVVGDHLLTHIEWPREFGGNVRSLGLVTTVDYFPMGLTSDGYARGLDDVGA